MKIFLATDHAGFELKESIKKYLLTKNHEVEDCGAFEFKADDDYPDFIIKAAEKVANEKYSLGIIFGKSGAGEAIAANKVKGIRAVVGFNKKNVELARKHNNANVLSLGSQFVSFSLAEELVSLFLNTFFANEERHIRRLEKIKTIEEKN